MDLQKFQKDRQGKNIEDITKEKFSLLKTISLQNDYALGRCEQKS